ncbi:hypothetical protein TRVL_06063 [Trypanosoma vivax]|nr:hypothetical protein TRVL_06063 [Trypanosoma vivax]
MQKPMRDTSWGKVGDLESLDLCNAKSDDMRPGVCEAPVSPTYTHEEHLQKANTVKSFHYHLQQRMAAACSYRSKNETEEHLWFRLIADESERLRDYATAMYDIATRYWGTQGSGNGREEARDACSCSVSSTCKLEGNRKRRRGAAEQEGEKSDLSGSHADDAMICQHNDRLEYSMRCVADYFLGISVVPHHGVKNIVCLSAGLPLPSEQCDLVCFEKLPLIISPTIKVWRRNFYQLHKRQAQASEAEAEAYCSLCRLGEATGGASLQQAPLRELPISNDDTIRFGCAAMRSSAAVSAKLMYLTRQKLNQHCQAATSQVFSRLYVTDSPLQALDIGSCYGPFEGKTISNGVLCVPLSVTGLDLSPYEGSSVLKGDWLAARFFDPCNAKDGDVHIGGGGGGSGENMESGGGEFATAAVGRCPLVRVYNSGASLDTKASVGNGEVKADNKMGFKLHVAMGAFDVVFFCLFLSFLPHPRLRYKACLHAYLALKDYGLLVIVSTRTQGGRRNCWVDEWVACIESIGFKRVHKNIMKQIVGMSFSKQPATEVDQSVGEERVEVWLRHMMDRPEAQSGLCIVGDGRS